MAFSLTASPSHLQSSSLLVPSFRLNQLLFSSSFNFKRRILLQLHHCFWHVRASSSNVTTLDSADGSVAAAANHGPDSYGRQYFPLAAVVGQDAIKTALLVGDIDREIGGIAISGRRGSAKTVMARGLHAILPQIEVVLGSIANADPTCPEEWEDGLAEKVEYDSAGNLNIQIVRSPFVQIPLGVSEDRLIGSVDVEESVKTGTTVFQPGLLC